MVLTAEYTLAGMGRRYINEALGRTDLVRLAHERGRWSPAVREAREAVELLLKGALPRRVASICAGQVRR